MKTIAAARRLAGTVLAGSAFAVAAIGCQAAAEDEGPFLSAEMRLYFEGPAIEMAKSAQSVVLIYLPVPDDRKSGYDRQHDLIEKTARRLSTDIQVVPLTGLFPAPDEHARNWLRAVDCDRRPSILPNQDSPALYFRFAGQSDRYCVGVASSSAQSARLISTLLDLEETGCSYNRVFVGKVLGWLETKSDAQYDGASLADHMALQDVLLDSAREACDGW